MGIEFYPSLFDSDFACFLPPKKLEKVDKEEIMEWFETYNSMEVVRFVYMSYLNDMVYLLHYQGSAFNEVEIDGYLRDFGCDPRYNDRDWARDQLSKFIDEWFEIAGTVRFIQESIPLEFCEGDNEMFE
jgi:hypothetical protein